MRTCVNEDNLLKPLDRGTRESVKRWTYRCLRHAVMTGRLPPGQAVTITGLAEELGVSPMPIREALHLLVADGALEHLDNRRVRVPNMTPEKFDETISARIALETVAAERAMPFVDEARLARMQALDAEIDTAYDTGDIETGIERNFAFHRCLYETHSAAVLLPLIESVWVRLGPFMREATENLEATYRFDRHAEAMQAIRDRDAAALRQAIISDIHDGAGYLGRKRFAGA
jgi:DNA-binding GntR family transcriptional regulator